MACCQFDGLAKHHTQGDIPETEFVGHLQCLTDIVAVFHEGLSRQVWIESLHKALTLATTVDHHTVRAAGLGYRHTFADAVYEGFFGEWLHDA